MRYREFKLTEQQLDELKMSPSSLGAFAKSPVAKGIQAGFEAELVFPGMAGDGGEMEPDYDEDARSHSIDEIINFFANDEWGWATSDRTLDRLRSQLEEAYWEYADEELMSNFREEAEDLIREYIEEHDFSYEEFILEYLTNELKLSDEEAETIMDAGRRATSTKESPPEYMEAMREASAKLDELAQESIENQDGTYDRVLESYRDNYDYPEERQWLSGQDLDYMSEVADRFSLDWPIWRGNSEEGYNEDNAQQLADDLSKTLGYKVKVSGSYHGQKKDSTSWYFEPDGSLDANDSEDMPVEIVSPPMPLDETLKALDDFFSWAKGHDAYTNRSTGFHMGVSLPEVGGKVDFVKLALFLGDEYVLNEFGRKAVAFCESAIKKIKNRIKGADDRVASAMNLMRKGLIDVAHDLIASDEGFGKYTSINPKGNYIEFRSAGGEDYFKDIPRLRNMLLRYAQAMVVAADPAAEKKEYYKKLYKLIAPATGNASLDLFARFAAGTISASELKQQWATATLSKEMPAGPTQYAIKSQHNHQQLGIVDATSSDEAVIKAYDNPEEFGSGPFYAEPIKSEPKPNRRTELAKRIKGPPVPHYYIMNDDTKEIVYLFNAENNKEASAMLGKYSDSHEGRFLYGQTRVLTPDQIAQGRKNTEADKTMPKSVQQQSTPQHPQQVRSPNGVPVWEIYNRVTGLDLYTFADHTQNLAWQTARTWAEENGFADRMDILSVRPVMPQD